MGEGGEGRVVEQEPVAGAQVGHRVADARRPLVGDEAVAPGVGEGEARRPLGADHHLGREVGGEDHRHAAVAGLGLIEQPLDRGYARVERGQVEQAVERVAGLATAGREVAER